MVPPWRDQNFFLSFFLDSLNFHRNYAYVDVVFADPLHVSCLNDGDPFIVSASYEDLAFRDDSEKSLAPALVAGVSAASGILLLGLTACLIWKRKRIRSIFRGRTQQRGNPDISSVQFYGEGYESSFINVFFFSSGVQELKREAKTC